MTQYQLKPRQDTPLDIPWHLIAPEWKCAAMDEDKIIWFYTVRPCKYTNNWATAQGYAADNVLIINTDGIDWENSLTFRPERQ